MVSNKVSADCCRSSGETDPVGSGWKEEAWFRFWRESRAPSAGIGTAGSLFSTILPTMGKVFCGCGINGIQKEQKEKKPAAKQAAQREAIRRRIFLPGLTKTGICSVPISSSIPSSWKYLLSRSAALHLSACTLSRDLSESSRLPVCSEGIVRCSRYWSCSNRRLFAEKHTGRLPF